MLFGYLPEYTREMTALIEAAADEVSETLPTPTGALLIVDNRFSLHERTKQTVDGEPTRLRQAWLCFVRQLQGNT